MRLLRQIIAAAVMAVGFSTAAMAQSFVLNGVNFDKSAYFTDDELQAVVKPYVGRPITFADLSAMMTALQEAYFKAGIVTVQPILPPQTLDQGVLRVSLLEASLDRVEIEGLERTSPSFLRRTISLAPGEKPNFDQIEQDLRVYELSHDIAPKIAFKPGQTTGTTTAIISGEEPEPLQFTASVDNFGREVTGRERLTLFGRFSSLTGVRDTLTVTAQAAKEAKSLALSYSRPVDDAGGRLVFGASISDASVLTNPTTGVVILSNTRSVSLGYRRPFRIEPNSAWFLDANLSAENSRSTIAGTLFSDVDLYDAYVGVSYQHREIGSSRSFDIGLRFGNAEALGTTSTEGTYAVLTFGAALARQITDSMIFEASLRGQLAPDQNLPVARLFAVGGATSVRGYPVNVKSGDSGLQIRTQISRAQPWNLPGAAQLSVTPFGFADVAYVAPFKPAGGAAPRNEILASVGAGGRLGLGDYASGILMAAVPLRNTQTFKDKGDPQVYFGLDFQF